MADQVKYPGRLIAVDGSRGKDVTVAAGQIAAALKRDGVDCVVSRWDASGLFTDLAAGGRNDRNVSIRTLALVYAADLAFRLRWEIRPALEAGGVVVAAPYVDTAAALGAIHGLGEEWLRLLMRFAPAPDFRGLAAERKIDKPWKRRADRGYAEYVAMMLATTAPKRVSKGGRRRMMELLDQSRSRKLFHLSTKGIDLLRKALTDSRQDASRRSASRPRNGRR
jgi:hypothetical protein